MAHETVSEKLVRIANSYYRKNKIADIEKTDAKMRLVGGSVKRVIFSGSTGLDFVGNCGGKYLSFEVKETQRDALPIDSIKLSQISKMEKIKEFGGTAFLLCYFSETKEWFAIGHTDINHAIELNASCLQREYFIAFGRSVPSISHNEFSAFPDFLHQEAHPLRDAMRQSFPAWLRYRRDPKPVEQLPNQKITIESYKERVRAALIRGEKSAERREQKVQIFKSKNR